jgi:hypothetical protein
VRLRDAHLFCRFFLAGGRSWVRKELFLHRLYFITLPDSCWEIFEWKRKWICSLQVQKVVCFLRAGRSGAERGGGKQKGRGRGSGPPAGRGYPISAGSGMGIFVSKLFSSFFGDREARILVLGLDNAGKTTILCIRVLCPFRIYESW